MDERFARSAWFRRDRFGLFIHWGLYSIPARGEWCRGTEKWDDGAYHALMRDFRADGFDPRAWARAAKAAGMRYAVFTAKHHDGFCLFDSALTDFKSTNSAAGRDLVRDFLDAFRAEGLRVGLYYSLIDWEHPAYPAWQHHSHPHRDDEAFRERRPFAEYLDYLHGQVRELCSRYGKLDLLWFDYSYGEMRGEKWRASELVRMVRSLQPDVLIDNRLEVSGEGFGSLVTDHPSAFCGDFVSPECLLPPEGIRDAHGAPVPWEACVTLNDHWGCCAADDNYKPAAVVIRKLVECASKGGNLLLNVGPDARGRFPAPARRVLAAVGAWMDDHAGAIRGGDLCAFPKPEWGRYIQNGNTVFAMVLDPPIGPLALPSIPPERIACCSLLRDGSDLPLFSDWRTANYARLAYVDLPRWSMYDPVCTVVKIELK